MRSKLNIIIFFIFISISSAYTQVNCITDPPLPPVLNLVSVQPETGNVFISWSLSPSPNIAAYIIYSYKNGDALALDTVWDPLMTSYTLPTTATKYLSVSYVVAAMRLPRCTSILSNALNTIFSEVSIDTCENRLLVKWNKYLDQPKKVNSYKILVSVNGEPFVETYSTGSGSSDFSFSAFTVNSLYCFIIKAILDDGNISASNKCCISTKMQKPPAWINADYASVTPDKKISLSFTVDPASEISQFLLEKKNLSENNYNQVSKLVSVNGRVTYTDNESDPEKISCYRLSAINNCSIPVTYSNIATNMVLTSEMTDDIIILSWNKYRIWRGNVSSYHLYIDTGNGFEEKAAIEATDSVYRLSYKDLMYSVTGDKVCFQIEASEDSNPYGVNGQSISSSICISPPEIITVPNVFTPNHDLLNDYFRPVLSFTPKNYHLVISDRKRNTLFETNDFQKEWDGSLNGKPQDQGVYLWYLEVTTPSGKNISKTGTVTIFHDQK